MVSELILSRDFWSYGYWSARLHYHRWCDPRPLHRCSVSVFGHQPSSGSSPLSPNLGGGSLIPINAHHHLPLHLNGNNFPSWVRHLFYGYDLFGFPYGSTSCLPLGLNPAGLVAHVLWMRPWFIISIDAFRLHFIVPLIANAESSTDAWTTLQCLYANPSRSRVTLYILNGLGPAYRDIAGAIRAREHPIQFTELHDLLVSQESYLCCMKIENLSLVAMANAANQQSQNPNCSGNWNTGRGGNNSIIHVSSTSIWYLLFYIHVSSHIIKACCFTWKMK